MSHNISELKQQFLEYVEIEKGRSQKTVRNYDQYLNSFIGFAKAKRAEDITSTIMRDYRLWLNRQKTGRNRNDAGETLKKKTQNYYLIALRAFLKYLAKRGIPSLAPEQIELAKVGERHIDFITDLELRRLLDAPDGNDLKSLRDKAMLELLFSTGLRVAELCSLSRDIDLSLDSFSIRGKGDKVRVVFLSDTARAALKKYLDKRADVDDALFVKVDAREKAEGEESRLTTRSIERIVKQYAVKAGISKKVTPHVIRHSFATDLLSNGADLRSVQMLLGDPNISTTQIYTHITDRQLRDVHKRFHGKSGK